MRGSRIQKWVKTRLAEVLEVVEWLQIDGDEDASEEVIKLVDDWIVWWQAHVSTPVPPAPVVVSATFTIEQEGAPEMANAELAINVDSSGVYAKFAFKDDHGDADAGIPQGPDGAPAALGVVSSDTTVITAAQNATDPTRFDLTLGTDGSATLTPSINEASTGQPLTDAQGNPLAPAPVTQAVSAGQAVSATFDVEEDAPAPPAPEPTPPAPTPEPTPPAATVALDPASQLPLYSLAAGTDPTTIDTTVWTAVTDVTGDAGATLYTFSGDTAGVATANGASAEWIAFDGTPTPVTPPA